MEIINSLDLPINYEEKDPIKRFPFLVGQPLQMILQKEGETFMVNFKYSYTQDFIVFEILNSNNEVIQRNTYLASFPCNLNLVDELLGYSLFFKKSKVVWCKTPDSFYNLDKEDSFLYESFLNEIL